MLALLTLFFKTFVGFFAVMDPIGLVPLFIVMTTSNTEVQRRVMIRRAVIAAFVVLLFFGITQMWLFGFFGFTMGAFRVAGGLFLFLLAFGMLSGQAGETKQTAEEKSEGVEKPDISIAPLAVPLLAGPATIASVVLAFGQAKAITEYIAVGMAALAVCVASWLILRASSAIHRLLGTTGVNVVSRMMGLLLAAMAIQFVANGMTELFPILGSP